LDPKVKDKNGMPVASVHYDDHPNDVAMRAHAYRQGSAIYRAVARCAPSDAADRARTTSAPTA
jgi:hypothetical protein